MHRPAKIGRCAPHVDRTVPLPLRCPSAAPVRPLRARALRFRRQRAPHGCRPSTLSRTDRWSSEWDSSSTTPSRSCSIAAPTLPSTTSASAPARHKCATTSSTCRCTTRCTSRYQTQTVGACPKRTLANLHPPHTPHTCSHTLASPVLGADAYPDCTLANFYSYARVNIQKLHEICPNHISRLREKWLFPVSLFEHFDTKR